MEVPRLIARGVRKNLQSWTPLELQHKICRSLGEPGSDHSAPIEESEGFRVCINRGRETKPLPLVARRQGDLSVGDDAPQASDVEGGCAEQKRIALGDMLVYASTDRPVQ